MKRLKIILQSNKTYFFLLVFIILYILIYKNFLNKSTLNNKDLEFYCTITDIKYNGNEVRLELLCKEKIISYRYFDSEYEMLSFKNKYIIGDKVKIIGSLKKIEKSKDSFLFNYKEYLNNSNIFYSIDIDEMILIKKANIIYRIRNYLYKRVCNLKSFPYVASFISTDKSYFNSELLDMFNKIGISHLLSISSFHIGILIILLCKKYKIRNRRKLFLIIMFICYIFLRKLSFLRAFLYIFLTIINVKFNLGLNPKKKIFLSFFLIILYRPLYIYSISFLYVFVVSSGFILLASKIYNIKSIIRRSLYTSYLSYLLLLPLAIYINNEINVITILATFIISPFIVFIMLPFAIIVFIFPFLDNLFLFFINIFEYLCIILSNISFCIILRKLSLISIFVYYIIIFLVISNKKYIIFLLFILLLHKNYNFFFREKYVFAIDVGQGDSILIHNGISDVLVDTGGEVSFYSDYRKKDTKSLVNRKTIPILKMYGIENIDLLVITHGDYDHMGEAINLVNNFKVEKVIFNCGEYNNLEQELIKVLDKKKIPYYSCIKELNIDKNKLYFLQTKVYDNENDNSNVIYTELGGYKFMFMGDASIDTEQEILNRYNLPDIDVLKVGHHGSKTSSSKGFINEINPKYSIISVGKNNRYGHPNKEVINNLEDSKIYRTDIDGSIMFKIKNNKLKIETCSP